MRQKQRDDRLIRPGMFAGLKFDDGWWFIEATETEFVELKPWTLENSNGNQAELASETAGVDDDEIVDSNNNRVLEPDDDHRTTVNQIFYGISPSRMQVFHLFGRDRNESLEDYDQPGDPAPITNGFDSPYNNPSRQTEIFYVNSMAPLRMQAYNPMNEAAEAEVSFHVNKIRYQTVTDKSLMKAMLQGQHPARIHEMGRGVMSRDQLNAPNWVLEAFGEHIYSTEEVLNSGGSGDTGRVDIPADQLRS